MDSRLLLLVVFVLLFASMTMACSIDGTNDVYQDGDNILDDLTGVFMNVVDYFVDLPTTVDGFVVVNNLDGAVASPGTPQGAFQYPSPHPTNMQPYVYPQGVVGQLFHHNNQMQTLLPNPANQLDPERMPDLTVWNVMQLNEPQPQQDVAVQSWVDDSYATGYRNQSPQFQQAPADMQSGQEQSHNNTMRANTRTTTNTTQTQQPSQTTNQPTASTASLGYLQCDHPGCRQTFSSRGELNHHIRCHIPEDERPHQCLICPRRFLYPREVRRHMATHGIGPRYHCPVPRCRLAIRTFARRDHLLRHIRRFHSTPGQPGVESILQS